MKFIILGCGSSMGVPRPDGYFGNCDPKNKKNYRTRCSALIKTSDHNILIDTSPDLRQQLQRHKIRKIDKVFFTISDLAKPLSVTSNGLLISKFLHAIAMSLILFSPTHIVVG